MVYRQSRFDPERFFDAAVINESRVTYIPMSSQVSQKHTYSVQLTTAKLQDYKTINLNQWTVIKKKDIFHLIPRSVYPHDDDQKYLTIAIEMHQDSLTYARTRYSFLDVLANFGGFMGIWRWIFTTFMAAWNTNALDNFMVSKLYKAKGQITAAENDDEDNDNGERLERSRWPHLGDYFMSCVPSCLVCCKKSEKAKAKAKARALLTREMNMVHLLQ